LGSWIPDTPKNQSQRKLNARERKEADLQCEEAVVDLDLLGEEIGANGGLVLVAELPVDVLVHQRRLADPAVAEDDDLEEHPPARRHGRGRIWERGGGERSGGGRVEEPWT